MKLFFSIAQVLCLGLLLCACKGNKVDISSRNFQDEIAQQQNLTFTFSHDLVGDTLLDKWDTTHYLEFEPKVRGKFKWTAANELTFSPDAGFAPSTDYKAEVTGEITRPPVRAGFPWATWF